MNLHEARQLADDLCAMMSPFCERIEIAGSIRREKPEVKDIELVVIPKWQLAPVEDQVRDLFGSPPKAPDNFNLLHVWAVTGDHNLRWIKPGTSEIVYWKPKPDGKYWRALLPSGIKLDLFLARPDNWGMIYLIRTGSAEFTTAVVTHAKKIGLPCVEGYLRHDGEKVETPEEVDVFTYLGLDYVEPPARVGWSSIQRSR